VLQGAIIGGGEAGVGAGTGNIDEVKLKEIFFDLRVFKFQLD
jgi:hypothetical protein